MTADAKAPGAVRRLQVVVGSRPEEPDVAGLPCALRAALSAREELRPERLLIVGSDENFRRRWSSRLRAAAVLVEPATLDAELPLLAFAADSFPSEGAAAEFFESAARAECARREVSGRTVSAYARDASALGAGSAEPAEVHARALSAACPAVSAGDFLDASSAAAARTAEAALYGRLTQDKDGYIARLDRRLSLRLTRLLLPFPVTPNQVTAASLILGFAGAYLLASGSARMQFLGASILWFCCLLDGCDGEIARLKRLATPEGERFDLFADHVAHLATFAALPIGVARLHPGADWRLPGTLLLSGVIASAFSVYRTILRAPSRSESPTLRVIERVASRDYVYLILAFTAVGRLDWFVWAAAVGSHVFWIWVWRAASKD